MSSGAPVRTSSAVRGLSLTGAALEIGSRPKARMDSNYPNPGPETQAGVEPRRNRLFFRAQHKVHRLDRPATKHDKTASSVGRVSDGCDHAPSTHGMPQW